MSRLVERVKGDGRRQGVTDDHMAPEHTPVAHAQGCTVDGEWFGLDGQPPMAQTRGWGDLSWLRSRRRR